MPSVVPLKNTESHSANVTTLHAVRELLQEVKTLKQLVESQDSRFASFNKRERARRAREKKLRQQQEQMFKMFQATCLKLLRSQSALATSLGDPIDRRVEADLFLNQNSNHPV